MDDEDVVLKRYKVKVTAEWEIEIEAADQYEAEYLAEDEVEGDHYFGVRPDYIDAWAEEITDGDE